MVSEEECTGGSGAPMRMPAGSFVAHVPMSSSQTRARRAAVVVSGLAAVLAMIAVASASVSGTSALSYAYSYAAPGYMGGYAGPLGGYYGARYPAATYPATRFPTYSAARYGVAAGLAGGPTLPMASVVARNAERVAANSDALLRLYQRANAGLFATNQMLLKIQNQVQAAEGTWSTVPMEFPASYRAGLPGVVPVPSAYGPMAGGAVTTTTVKGVPGIAAATTVVTAIRSLKDADAARATHEGLISAAVATASSPVAATAAINKAATASLSAPPGFHLAWVPNQNQAALASAPSLQAGSNAWNWRPLARAKMIAPAVAPHIYKSESKYPYISGTLPLHGPFKL